MAITHQASKTSGLSARVLQLFEQMRAVSHSQTTVHRRLYESRSKGELTTEKPAKNTDASEER